MLDQQPQQDHHVLLGEHEALRLLALHEAPQPIEQRPLAEDLRCHAQLRLWIAAQGVCGSREPGHAEDRRPERDGLRHRHQFGGRAERQSDGLLVRVYRNDVGI